MSPSSSILHWLPFSPLGSGSFGHVSLALNLHDSSLFAAKSALSASSSSLLALHNEFHILQSLHSPFILTCLGADLSPLQSTPPHIFLEYMDGGSLADLLRRSGGKLHDENLIKHYTHAILLGLEYLHRNGVVHCDIKSQNILIGSSGIKIADFGAAWKMGETSILDGTVRGTPLWMAPEVIKGEEQGPPSDIWSLGCTVVEMVQGKPPWAHMSNMAALFMKVGGSEENPPLPESLSAEGKDFLLRCLEREPNARATAEELLQHPFLRGCRQYEGKVPAGNQTSPRSTLDFCQSESESEWEAESMVTSAPVLKAPECSSRGEMVVTSCMELEGGELWITVRQAEGWSEKKRLPFMQAAAAGKTLLVRRACKVNLDCAAFLSNRRRGTRVG